jgi:polysaccharide biosynthesis transport protein
MMLGHRRLSAAEYLGIWRRRGKWALVCCLLGTAAGGALAFAVPAKYTSTATVVWTERRVPAAGEPVAARLAELRKQILTGARLQEANERLGLHPLKREGVTAEGLDEQLRRHVVLAPIRLGSDLALDSTTFALSCTGSDGKAAQQLCVGVVAVLQQENIRKRAEQAQETTNASLKEVDEARGKLDERNAKVASFLRRHPELSGGDGGAAESSVAGYKAQLEAAGEAVRRAQQERAALVESLQARQPAALTAHKTESANVQALERELATEQASLVTLEARYTPDHPDVVKLKADIARLQNKIDETKKAEAQAAGTKPDGAMASEPPQAPQWRARIRELDLAIREKTQEQERLQQTIQASQARLANRPILENEYRELTRDLTAAKAVYDSAVAKQNAAQLHTELAPGERQEVFLVADTPSLPDAASFPNPVLFTLGGAGSGLATGLLVMLVVELRDKTLRTEGDIEHFLALPTLAVIPAGEEDSRGGWGHPGARREKGVLTDA